MALILGAAPVEAMLRLQFGDSATAAGPIAVGLLLPGVLLQIAAIALGARAVYHLARGHAEGKPLIVSGPYSRMRHPLSLARAMHGAGGGLMLDMHVGWLAWVFGAGLLLAADRQDERALEALHPEAFARWRRVTGRYWPSLRNPHLEAEHD